jgi:uncharacterized protein Smg (DUF494 family)
VTKLITINCPLSLVLSPNLFHTIEVQKALERFLALVMEVVGTMQAHLGKQAVARWYFPPEVDYRLSVLPKNSKGLILWIIEAQVQFPGTRSCNFELLSS